MPLYWKKRVGLSPSPDWTSEQVTTDSQTHQQAKQDVCPGVVVSIQPASAVIRMLEADGCSTCAVGGTCAGSGADRLATVALPGSARFFPGQEVLLVRPAGSRLVAALLVFVLPVLLLAGGIGIGWLAGWNEPLSAGAGFLLASLYYLGLVPFRHRLEQYFTLQVIPVPDPAPGDEEGGTHS